MHTDVRAIQVLPNGRHAVIGNDLTITETGNRIEDQDFQITVIQDGLSIDVQTYANGEYIRITWVGVRDFYIDCTSSRIACLVYGLNREGVRSKVVATESAACTISCSVPTNRLCC